MIERLDHLVLTVANIENTIAFYVNAFDMQEVTFKGDRKALVFGNQKINLHQAGNEFEPKAKNPAPGSADLCFITDMPLEDVVHKIQSHGIEVIEGPVERTGATDTIMSIYIRDPDGNLIEISNTI